MIPTNVQKMIMKPGVYLVSDDRSSQYFVAHVDENGEVQQMKFDGVLLADGWKQGDYQIRGPLWLDSEPI